jgi:hypothetical protein
MLAQREDIVQEWHTTTRRFAAAVRENRSVAGVLRALGLRVAGGNYAVVRRRVKELSLSTGHWTGSGHRDAERALVS